MARILKSKFEKINKERNTVHKPVLACYCCFYDKGEHFFQIDTYGSIDRKMPGKISQSMQFDEDMAKVLVDTLKKEFSLN